MANELSVDVAVAFTKTGSETITVRKPAQAVTVAGTRGAMLTQKIAITEEQVDIGELPTVGWVYFENMDATNYIELFITTGGTAFARLLPGRGFAMPIFAATFYAKSHTAACWLRTVPFEQ